MSEIHPLLIFPVYISVSDFAKSDEGEAGELLLKAWNDGDQEALASCLALQSFSFLENEVCVGIQELFFTLQILVAEKYLLLLLLLLL